MKTCNPNPISRRDGFTLIELLVVMAVIAVLAAMIFPVAGIVKRNAAIKRVQTQMRAIESAIETYKQNVKVYPPENPVSPANPVHLYPHLNMLYYELGGARLVGTEYQPLNGNGNATELALRTFLGNGVPIDQNSFGIVNLTRGAAGVDDDEKQSARNCIPNIEPSRYLALDSGVTVLGVTDVGLTMLTNTASGKIINPWRYTSTRATNNVGSYDLWVDITVGGKNYRICNWNDKYITLP